MGTTVPAYAALVALLVSAILARALYNYLSRRRHRLRFAAVRHCKTATSTYPHILGLQGLDFVFENARNIFNHRFTEGIHQLFRQHGDTYTSHIFGHPIVNTIDPENLESVMITDFESWTIIPARAKLVTKLFGKGVFAAEGSDWKHSRALIRRGMKTTYQPDVLEQHMRVLLKTIEACNGEAFDFTANAFDYSFNVAKDLLIGQDVVQPQMQSTENAAMSKFAADFGSLVNIARVVTIFNRQIPYLANIIFWSTYTHVRRRVFTAVDWQISKALQEKHQQDKAKTDSECLIKHLVYEVDDVSRIRSEALNLLLGGRDSVGISLSETFYLLARHPTVWAKLRHEVNSVCSNNVPTQEELKIMTYLNNVINEVLRLRPPLSVHGRRAIKDTCLPRGGGPAGQDPLFVAKGTYLMYSNYALHRRHSVFGADVEAFRPERWEHISPKRFEYMSFGAGYRNCPGRKMAWVMLAYAIARMAQKVERLEPRDDRPWQESTSFSFFNANGTRISTNKIARL